MRLKKTFLKFKKKTKTFVNKTRQMFTVKNDKEVVLNSEINFPKPDLDAVISTILYFKSSTNYIQNEFSEKNSYEIFEDYILKFSEGDKIPKSKIIEDDLNISEGDRKKLYKEALIKELLIKDDNGRHKLNINYEKEEQQDV